MKHFENCPKCAKRTVYIMYVGIRGEITSNLSEISYIVKVIKNKSTTTFNVFQVRFSFMCDKSCTSFLLTFDKQSLLNFEQFPKG